MGDNVIKLNAGETLAEIVDRRLAEISHTKTQTDVAREMGFPTPNFMTMVKKGKSKMALNRIGDLADALDMDFHVLFIAALRQYYDDEVITLMRRAFSGAVTKSEHDLLDLARSHTDMQKGLSNDTRKRIVAALKDNQPMRH